VRYLAGENSTAFLVSASIPLPLFHRNQGAVAEAGDRLAQVGDEERAARARASRELASEYQTLSAARAKALAYRGEVLPASGAALYQVRGGYLEGRFSELEVIDAQRTLFAARAAYLDALSAYHRSAAAIERLTAAALAPPPRDVRAR
jgi:cobalt-zinc-cadmium efflux system outer membrane protein